MSVSGEKLTEVAWLADNLGADPQPLLIHTGGGDDQDEQPSEKPPEKPPEVKVPEKPPAKPPVIEWANPADVTWVRGGYQLSEQQLNAVLHEGDGVLVYEPALGALLPPGTHDLVVRCAATPAYLAGSKTVRLVVNAAEAVITWEAPQAKPWTEGGFKLGKDQLCASISEGAGPLVYEPAEGTLLEPGTHTLKVSAVAHDGFKAASHSVSFSVKRVPVKITWAAPKDVLMESGGFTLGDEQLAASVDVPAAKLTYTPAKGVRLQVNTHTLKAEVADPVHYEATAVSVSLVVKKRTPTITWAAPASQPWTEGGFKLGPTQLCASITEGASPLVYLPADGELLEPLTHTLKVSAEANEVFEAAHAEVPFTVKPAPVTITWDTPAPVDAAPGGFVLGSAQLAAKAEPATAKLSYTPSLGARLKAGTHELKAELADTLHYEAAAVTVKLQVKKLVPEIVWEAPDPVDHVSGGFKLTVQQLNASVTPGAGALVYAPALNHPLPPGTHELEVSCAATELCEAASLKVKFTVRKQRAVVTWATPAAVEYVDGGFLLTGTQLSATALPAVDLLFEPPLNTPLAAGEHVLKVKPAKPNEVEFAEAAVTLVVKRKAAVITWSEPAAVVAGGPTFTLTDAQNNAVRTAGESVLTYAPPTGGTVPVGSNLLTANHAQSANYGSASRSVRLNVYANADRKSGYDALRGGGGFKPATPLNGAISAQWNADTGGIKTQAQTLMKDMQDMTGPELLTYMNNLVANPGDRQLQPGAYPNYMWKLPNGLQVRYKPNGDVHVNPSGTVPVPMFCIEVRTPGVGGFSASQNDIATKVSSDGGLSPKGPGQTSIPAGPGSNDFVAGSVEATHLRCRQNPIAQTIVAPPSVDLPHGTKLSVAALGIRLEPGNGAITLNPAIDTVLPVGDNQVVAISAAATDRFAAAGPVNVVVNVKKAKPGLSWASPPDVDWVDGGYVLGDAVLKAKAEPDTHTAAIEYTPARGSKLDPGDHELQARLPATAERDEVVLKVQLHVRKAMPIITWAQPAEVTEAVGGVLLDGTLLNASAKPTAVELVYTPPAGTRLGAGVHSLRVHTKPHAQYRQAAATVTLTINPATN